MSRKILITILIVCCCRIAIFSKNKVVQLKDVYNFNKDLSTSSLNAKSKGIAGFQTKEGIVSYPSNYSVNVDERTGAVVLEYSSKMSKMRVELDKSFKLKKIHTTQFDDEAIKMLKSNESITEYDEKSGNLVIKHMLYGEVKKVEKIKYDSNTVTFNTLYAFFQVCILNGINDFYADIVFPGQNDRYSAEFLLQTTDDLLRLSPEYENVPDYFSSYSKQKQDVYVYVLRLKGIPGTFYPHKFYFAFEKKAPHRYIGYWGGSPKDANFHIMKAE